MTTTVTATSTATATATDTSVEVRDCRIILQETFEESPGYDNEGWIESGTVDPDSSIPGGVSGWGSECLYIGEESESGDLYIYIPEQNIIYFSFEFYLPASWGNDMVTTATELLIYNPEFSNCMLSISIECINTVITGHLTFNDFVDTDTKSLSRENKYKIEVYANKVTGDWKWKIDGNTEGSGNLEMLYTAGVLDIYTQDDAGAGTYVDNIDVRTEPPTGW